MKVFVPVKVRAWVPALTSVKAPVPLLAMTEPIVRPAVSY